MNRSYDDIRSRIAEEPQWWDECAVPRYCPFSVGQIANIYANEAALVEIACQGCGQRFLVEVSRGAFDQFRLQTDIRRGVLAYGDPPNIGCCLSGPTMSSDTIRVVEYWKRLDGHWKRDKTFEGEVKADA